MRIEKLSLVNFKNNTHSEYFFEGRFTAIIGENGVGKTNILDAIHVLSMTRSYFHNSDRYNIRFGQDFYRISSTFLNETGDLQSCVVKNPRNGAKEVVLDQVRAEKLADHIGKIPVIFITPGDHRLLIFEGNKERQRFVDMCISQVNALYLQHLMKYNKLLKQRNSVLKRANGQLSQQTEFLLQAIEEQMKPCVIQIYVERQKCIQRLNHSFTNIYKYLSNASEKMTLSYKSHVDEGDVLMDKLWKGFVKKDIALGYTTRGTHRDDMVIKMDGRQIKNIASQGQVKTMVIALKLAQFDYMMEELKNVPIILLDDVCEKLDESRLEKLMELLSKTKAEQIILTDTSYSKVSHLLLSYKEESDFIFIERKTENNNEEE